MPYSKNRAVCEREMKLQMPNDGFFRDDDLKPWVIGPPITERELNTVIPQYFDGKERFVAFYLRHNGVSFKHGAYLYRDTFYPVTSGDDNSMAIESFFFIPH